MAKKNNENFESNMNRLKEIVDQLEKDNVSLDKSLELYKEGLELSKQLKKELSSFEDKISKLAKEDNE